MKHELTPEQARALAELEAGIKLMRQSAFAIRQIRDKRLYRNQFASGKDYCERRLGMTVEQVEEYLADAPGLPENN